MADFSNFLADAVLKHWFGGAAQAQPTGVYVHLYTAVSNAKGAVGTEVVGGAYARVLAVFTAPSGTPSIVSNSGVVNFTTPSASWGVVAYACLRDQAGNPLSAIKALPSPRTIEAGDTVRFDVGTLTFTLD